MSNSSRLHNLLFIMLILREREVKKKMMGMGPSLFSDRNAVVSGSSVVGGIWWRR
ncbi:hypothetical protein HanXRQr2_Chr17g0792361 [Helianthus annuus]|uniref:Uncharacterized protein n=1 Tax=Helianthus annuus TaxID=4232 RepID=A0A9K3DH04_HELAN|nr:hypothetical protein HanXRQr2_Chr17g0792361 [Helianthus annuus]KAJ0432502.1 hypothetical protein HanIR_Chr17g0859931 [Helianthus annuus]KAJ0812286.1 hypothetical protein HanPSC8_Chr17g0760321 [Helianthus annuus]